MIINYATARNEWCVYAHHAQNTLIWIGCAPVLDVPAARDARKSSNWRCYAKMSAFNVSILSTYTTAQEAQEAATAARVTMRPLCRPSPLLRVSKAVRCIEDGREFETIEIAADALGVLRSTIYNHLAKRPGYRTVKGLTFERISTPHTLTGFNSERIIKDD